jgi:hypothetical protein
MSWRFTLVMASSALWRNRALPDTRPPALDPLGNELVNLTLLSHPDNDRVANRDCGKRGLSRKKPIYGDSASLMIERLARQDVWTPAELAASVPSTWRQRSFRTKARIVYGAVFKTVTKQ